VDTQCRLLATPVSVSQNLTLIVDCRQH